MNPLPKPDPTDEEVAEEVSIHSFLHTQNNMKEKLSPSEAVYGFAAWLSTREQKTIFSSSDNCAPIAELVDEFVKANQLKDPRDNWQNDLVHPEPKPKIIPSIMPHPTLGHTGHGDECLSDADPGL